MDSSSCVHASAGRNKSAGTARGERGQRSRRLLAAPLIPGPAPGGGAGAAGASRCRGEAAGAGRWCWKRGGGAGGWCCRQRRRGQALRPAEPLGDAEQARELRAAWAGSPCSCDRRSAAAPGAVRGGGARGCRWSGARCRSRVRREGAAAWAWTGSARQQEFRAAGASGISGTHVEVFLPRLSPHQDLAHRVSARAPGERAAGQRCQDEEEDRRRDRGAAAQHCRSHRHPVPCVRVCVRALFIVTARKRSLSRPLPRSVPASLSQHGGPGSRALPSAFRRGIRPCGSGENAAPRGIWAPGSPLGASPNGGPRRTAASHQCTAEAVVGATGREAVAGPFVCCANACQCTLVHGALLAACCGARWPSQRL